jgi:hypothetical protein
LFTSVTHVFQKKLFQRHAFRQPVRPIEPPTPRASVLGLDRLAQEKRDAASSSGGSRKKPRLDNDDEPVFKGVISVTSGVCRLL